MADEQGAIPECMKAWAGGESAPADWDGGRVLGDDGEYYEPYDDGGLDWKHGLSARGIGADIIAYTPAADRLTDTGEGATSGGEVQGTFACPICGDEKPHHHTPVVVDAYQNKRSRT